MTHKIIAMVTLASIMGACDGVEVEDRDLDVQDVQDEQLAPGEIEAPPASAKSKTPDLNLVDAENPSAGPPGKACCADCGDYSSYWYNLGYGDNCNHTAAQWCSNHGYSFINAEWRTPYTSVQCY